MSAAIDDFLVRLAPRLELSETEREACISSLRAHLQARIDERRRAHAEESAEAAAHSILKTLGDPAMLSVRREAGSLLIVAPDGRAVYRVTPPGAGAAPQRARAGDSPRRRRTGRAAVWTGAVCVAVILLCTGILTVALYDDVRDVVQSQEIHLLHHTTDDCARSCTTGETTARTFHVQEGARHVSFRLAFRPAQTENGTAQVGVFAPDGTSLYAQSFESDGAGGHTDRVVWPAQAGAWRIETGYSGFAGKLSVTVYQTGGTR